MKRSITLVFLGLMSATAAQAGSGHDHWGYSGHTGPDHWGELKNDFSTCKTGVRQSPIDIDFSKAISANMGDITFDYQTVKPLVLNNGHTIQVNYDQGSRITVADKSYELAQFHFHAPSENTVNGKAFDMEMHLVHKNDKGELAVVGVFLKQGKHNAELEKAWQNMPKKAGDKQTIAASLNASNLLPANRSFAHFNGSLTTPPCSEGVSWFVINEPVEASAEQIAKFIEIVGNNARPIQQLNSRFVLGSR